MTWLCRSNRTRLKYISNTFITLHEKVITLINVQMLKEHVVCLIVRCVLDNQQISLGKRQMVQGAPRAVKGKP